MLKVKVFPGRKSEEALEGMVNQWLSKNERRIRVVDVKFGYTAAVATFGPTTAWYSAMVIYDEP